MAGERVRWADAARGLAITLVVLHHAMRRTFWRGGTELWEPVTEMVATVRMPLFFLVAGLFAAPWLTERSWRRMLDTKVLLFAWVFVLWLGIRYVWFLSLPSAPAGETAPPGDLVMRLLAPESAGWFIYALAILFVVGKAVSDVPVAVQLLATGAVGVLWSSGTVVTGNLAWDGVAAYAFFFLAGAHLRQLWLDAATWLEGARVPAVVAAWALCYVLCVSLGATSWLGVSFGLRVMGAAAGVALAVGLQRNRALGAAGRSTLPVYLVHPLLVIPGARFLDSLRPLDSDPLWSVCAPFVIALPVLVATYWFGRLAPRIGLGWLFEKPAWLSLGMTTPPPVPVPAPADRAWPR